MRVDRNSLVARVDGLQSAIAKYANRLLDANIREITLMIKVKSLESENSALRESCEKEGLDKSI